MYSHRHTHDTPAHTQVNVNTEGTPKAQNQCFYLSPLYWKAAIWWNAQVSQSLSKLGLSCLSGENCILSFLMSQCNRNFRTPAAGGWPRGFHRLFYLLIKHNANSVQTWWISSWPLSDSGILPSSIQCLWPGSSHPMTHWVLNSKPVSLAIASICSMTQGAGPRGTQVLTLPYIC